MPHTPRHVPETTLPKQSFLDSFDADTIVDWLTKYGKNIVYVLLGLIVLFVLVYRLSSSSAAKSEKDYLQAAVDFSMVMRDNGTNDDSVTQEALTRLTALMNIHPELHPAYDGAIGQALLNQGETIKAKSFIVNTLQRTQAEHLMLYNQFAATSLLISEAQYKEALEKSQALQHIMLDQLNQDSHSVSDVLFALNLLRIAMLQQQLGNDKEELQAWQNWKNYAGLEKTTTQKSAIDPMAFRIIIQQLATGNIALPDYIAYREELLRN